MAREIERTTLPGVGVRFTFTSASGGRISVLHHHSGRREVFVDDPRDPDASIEILDLEDEDSRTLAELLGGSRVVREIGDLQQAVEGLAIDWLEVEAGSAAAGRTIGQLELRKRTGVTVLAVVRDDATQPGPGPSFTLQRGDTVVVFGSPADIRRVQELVRG